MIRIIQDENQHTEAGAERYPWCSSGHHFEAVPCCAVPSPRAVSAGVEDGGKGRA